MDRRTFLTTAPIILSAPNILFGGTENNNEGSREFKIIWRDMNVGYSGIRAYIDGQKLRTEIKVKLHVKLFGITFYSYSLENFEVWERGKLIELNAQSKENNRKKQLRVYKTEDSLFVEGSKFSGIIHSDNVATTSYFTSDFLRRNVWINTDSGKPLNVDFQKISKETIPTFDGNRSAEKWVNSGELDLTLFYDERGDWIGSNFPVRGEVATMLLDKESKSINALWEYLYS